MVCEAGERAKAHHPECHGGKELDMPIRALGLRSQESSVVTYGREERASADALDSSSPI